VDIFALGIVIYYLLCGGFYPHRNEENLSSFRKSIKDDIVSIVSEGEDKHSFSEEA